MTGKNLEIISQIVLWYENSFPIDWYNMNIYKYDKINTITVSFRLIA